MPLKFVILLYTWLQSKTSQCSVSTGLDWRIGLYVRKKSNRLIKEFLPAHTNVNRLTLALPFGFIWKIRKANLHAKHPRSPLPGEQGKTSISSRTTSLSSFCSPVPVLGSSSSVSSLSVRRKISSSGHYSSLPALRWRPWTENHYLYFSPKAKGKTQTANILHL